MNSFSYPMSLEMSEANQNPDQPELQETEPNPTDTAERDAMEKYIQHEKETFTGPLRESWEKEQELRLQKQAEEEQREQEAMLARAEEQRRIFMEKLARERQERLTKAPPPKPEQPQLDPDDLAGGWKQVMKMVSPSGKTLPEKDVKQIKRLYFSLKE